MSETAGRGPLKPRAPKPAVRYDFSKGYTAQSLPPEAVVAMRARGIGTNRMEQQLRSYLRFRGVDEARPSRVLQIISRYVDVYPVSFIEMERAVGRSAARAAMQEVPDFTWWIQDFLDYIDVRRGHQHREEINPLIESMLAHRGDYLAVSKRHLARTGYTLQDVARHHNEQEGRSALAQSVRST